MLFRSFLFVIFYCFKAHEPLERLSVAAQRALAADLALAALVGEKVFNFGDLVRLLLSSLIYVCF